MSNPNSWSNFFQRTLGLGVFALWVGVGVPFMMNGPSYFRTKQKQRTATWEADNMRIVSYYGPNDSDHKVKVILSGDEGKGKIIAHGNSGLIEMVRDGKQDKNKYASFRVEDRE